MVTPITQNWRQDLLGREEELEWLQNAWKEAMTGKPQIRVLTAESGYGKTKIVHSFYAWLAARHDPDGYWPKKLPAGKENLSIMPKFTDSEINAEIPWFWWGSRWEIPVGHNRCLTTSPLLVTKEDPAFEWQRKSLCAKLDDNKALAKASIGALKAILALFPPAAMYSSAASAASDLKEAFDILTSLKNDRNLRASITAQESSKLDEFLATSSLILGKNIFGERNLPMVLILDDAQWMEPLSLMMVHNIWNLANKKKWKLLIIGTHWERNWNEQILNDSEENSFAAWFVKLPKYQIRTNSTPPPQSDLTNVEQWRLGKLEEVDELLRQSFKSLTEEQIKMFTERVSGNPLHMQEVIRLLAETKDEWFEEGDLNLSLSPTGFKEAMNYDLDLEKLERSRFNRTAKAVKQVIGAGSTQGERFVSQFATDVAGKLGMQEDNEKLLEEAIDPLALAEKSGVACTEFRSRTIHESAEKFIKNTQGAERIARAIMQTACEWSNSGKLLKLSEDLSTRLFSLTHDYATKHPDQVDDIKSLFEIYFSRGEHQHHRLYNTYAAYETYEQAIHLACAFETECERNEEVRHLHAKAICLMGNLGMVQEPYLPASVHFKKCFKLCEENLKLFGETKTTLRDYSRMAINIGYMHANAGNETEAEKYFSKALDTSSLLISKYGPTSENLHEKILAIEPLGKSGALFPELLKLIDQLRDLQETSAEHVGRMIYSLNLAASSHENFGDHKEALVVRRESLQLAEIVASENSGSLSWLLTLTEQYYFLSQTLKNLDLLEESDVFLKTAHSHSIDYSKRSEDFRGENINDQIEQALGLVNYSDFTDDAMTDEEMAFWDHLNQESIGL